MNPTLNYGDTISLCYFLPDGPRLIPSNGHVVGDEAINVALAAHGTELDGWTLIDPDFPSSNLPIRFGYRVALISAMPSYDPYYLSARGNVPIVDDSVAMGLVPRMGDWERWGIFDPDNENSQEIIRIGDTIALKSLNGYYLSGDPTPGVDVDDMQWQGPGARRALDQGERWKLAIPDTRFVPDDYTSYVLLGTPAGSCVEISDDPNSNRVQVGEFNLNSDSRRQFKITQLSGPGSQYYSISSKDIDKRFTVEDGSTDLGTPIQQHSPIDRSDGEGVLTQQFFIMPFPDLDYMVMPDGSLKDDPNFKPRYYLRPLRGPFRNLGVNDEGDGSPLVLVDYDSLFYLSPTGDGNFYIIPAFSGKPLKSSLMAQNGMVVGIEDDDKTVKQRGGEPYPHAGHLFEFEQVDHQEGYYRIKSKRSGYYLQARRDGDDLQVLMNPDKLDEPGQMFRFEPAKSGYGRFRIIANLGNPDLCLRINSARLELATYDPSDLNQVFWPVSLGVMAAQQFLLELHSSAFKPEAIRGILDEPLAEVVKYAKEKMFLRFSEADLIVAIRKSHLAALVLRDYMRTMPIIPVAPEGEPQSDLPPVPMWLTATQTASGKFLSTPETMGLKIAALTVVLFTLNVSSSDQDKHASLQMIAAVFGGHGELYRKVLTMQLTGIPYLDDMVRAAAIIVLSTGQQLIDRAEMVYGVLKNGFNTALNKLGIHI
ncbi:MAG TPA: hypothetical protein VKA60_26310 [Blastocatellia bacterium]|nr:hypothetical protein [Blastocatellia bacterium]